MEDKKKAEIIARLSELETEYQMRILLAVEGGSRAYGCASENSDYDIRLIYVYPMERYLCLSSPADSIALQEGKYDIHGWELQRALLHASRSNATFWEWMKSRVLLNRQHFATRLCDVANLYFSEKPMLYAQKEAIKSYRNKTVNGKMQAKHCLGVMRVAMQAVYMMQYHTAPPIDIETLLNQTVLPGTQDAEECRKLLELCRNGQKDTPYLLSCELAKNIEARMDQWLQTLSGNPQPDLSALDKFFQAIILDRVE